MWHFCFVLVFSAVCKDKCTQFCIWFDDGLSGVTALFTICTHYIYGHCGLTETVMRFTQRSFPQSLYEQQCILSAHASLSQCARWQRLQDKKLAVKTSTAAYPVSVGGHWTHSPLKQIRPVWLTACFGPCPLLPLSCNSVSSLLLCHRAIANHSCLCVYRCCFFCLCSLPLSFGALSSVSFQAKRIKSHLAPPLPLRTAL